jgi:hypothetical protein
MAQNFNTQHLEKQKSGYRPSQKAQEHNNWCPRSNDGQNVKSMRMSGALNVPLLARRSQQ